jgi:PKD repeat protein
MCSFKITFYNYGTIEHLWDFGDGATSTNNYDAHTYTAPADITVRLIVKEPEVNCSDTAFAKIKVKDFNTAFAFSTSFLSNNSCPPVLVRINNLSVGANRVVWDFW